jgi:predicted NAD-dependent protein-ADP-ribosyltransferase YbiA (DUF1768 family)
MNYSLPWLKNQIENGLHPEYLFFWGHSQNLPGVTDKSCFSQWWPAPFVVDGTTYATAEHWMMAKKALLFEDKESFAFEFVTEGNLYKFSQHEALKQFLLQTGDKILVEASPVDFIWGIGLSLESDHVNDPFKWKGQIFWALL